MVRTIFSSATCKITTSSSIYNPNPEFKVFGDATLSDYKQAQTNWKQIQKRVTSKCIIDGVSVSKHTSSYLSTKRAYVDEHGKTSEEYYDYN